MSAARFLFVALLIAWCGLLPASVRAQAVDPSEIGFGLETEFTQTGIQTETDIRSLVASIINISLGFLGIVAVLLIMYAGFLWTTARGDEKQVEKAKLILRNAVIGLAIIMASWGIATFILHQLKQAAQLPDAPPGGPPGVVPPILPSDTFRLQAVQTSHLGTHSGDNVTLCSNVQAQLNHWINHTTVDAAVAAASLSVMQTESGRDSGGTPVTPPAAVLIDIESRSNIIRFDRSEDADWDVFSKFEVRVPKTVSDYVGKPLVACTEFGCEDRGAYVAWPFTTTNANDTLNPYLVSAYPATTTPDRNVDRSATLSFDFSESIDAFSIVDADGHLLEGKILIEEITYTQEQSPEEMAPVAAIPREHFDIALRGDSIHLALNAEHAAVFGDGPYFEPYTWYRVTISGITDLCGLPMSQTGPWLFQTNGNTPGVLFTYPKRDDVCQDVQTFIRFKTSMYDVHNTSCAVSPNTGGLVLSGEGIANRALAVTDDLPPPGAVPANPNDFCRRYDFGSPDDLLNVGATYEPAVIYRNPANPTVPQPPETWSFGVAPAGSCVRPPYLSSLQPEYGGWQRCLTTRGGYLYYGDPNGVALKTALSAQELASTTLSAAVKTAWTDHPGKPMTIDAINQTSSQLTDLIGEFITAPSEPLPAKDLVQFEVWAQVAVPHVDTIESNHLTFTANTQETYAGPCLTSVIPSRGERNKTNVTLNGKRLGAGSSGNAVTFANNVLATEFPSWELNAIQTKVPVSALDGYVQVQVGTQTSNGVYFDVVGGEGANCSAAPNQCAPEEDLCSAGLICSTTCTCEAPQFFSITSVSPTHGCQDSCTNTAIQFQTNANIASLANIVGLQRCANATCEWNGAGSQNVPISVSFIDADRTKIRIVPASGLLQRGSWYRVVVAGLTAQDGRELTGINFDSDHDPDEELDSYSWTFRTGSGECTINRLDLSPSKGLLYGGSEYVFNVSARSLPNSCASSGQTLVVPDTFAWGDAVRTAEGSAADECVFGTDPIGETKLRVDPGFTTASSTAQVSAFPDDDRTERPAWVCVRHPGNTSVSGAAEVTLKPRCRVGVAADCQINSCNSICEGDTGICLPKLTGFSPTTGILNTWITLNGCYFGNDWGKVRVGSTDAQPPDVALCGNTWTDTQIIASVSSSGVVQVVRTGDNKTATLGSSAFNIGIQSYPAICRAIPVPAKKREVLNLVGHQFGLLGADSNIIFSTSTISAETRQFVASEGGCPENGWSDKHICVRVSEQAAPGPGAVKVVDQFQTQSAGYNIRVLGDRGRDENTVDLEVVGYEPSPDPACLNTVAQVTILGALDEDSIGVEPEIELDSNALALSNFMVLDDTDTPIPGTIRVYAERARTRLRFVPKNPFTASKLYHIVLLGFKEGVRNGLRSTSGGTLLEKSLCPSLGTDVRCAIPFTTVSSSEDSLCRISHFELAPNNPVFTCAGNGCDDDDDAGAQGHQHLFLADPINFRGQIAVINTPIVWNSSEPTIISVRGPKTGEPTGQVFDVNPTNGETRIRATSAIEGSDITGATDARVFLCQHPWPPAMGYDGVTFNDIGGDVTFTTKSVKTNFSTFYCRDQEEGDSLPVLAGVDANPDAINAIEFGKDDSRSTPHLLKEIFLVQPYSRTCVESGATCAVDADCGGGQCTGEVDAIGIRVLENPGNDTVQSWYGLQSFAKGSPKEIKVDHFAALQDGRTIYVGAPNDTSPIAGGDNTVYNNIYLISVNDNAHPDTMAIYSQLKDNWKFLANLALADEADKVRRDIVRLSHLRQFASVLSSMPNPPALTSGSYTPGLSLSTWPSWQGALSDDFGAVLPEDPDQRITCGSTSTNADTCWKAGSVGYDCDSNQSQFYLYRSNAGSVSVHARLEYGLPSRWNGLLNDHWQASSEQCMNVSYFR